MTSTTASDATSSAASVAVPETAMPVERTVRNGPAVGEETIGQNVVDPGRITVTIGHRHGIGVIRQFVRDHR